MIELSIGNCKSGKTTTMKGRAWRLVVEHRRPMVWVDVNDEVNGDSSRLRAPMRIGIVHSASGVERALSQAVPYRLVVVRTEDPTPDLVDEIARIVNERRNGTVLALPEAHRYMEEGKPTPPNLKKLLHQYQHFRSALLADTQHFADIRKEVLREVTMLYLHAQSGYEDIVALRKRFGPELVTAVREINRRFTPVVDGGLGERGWHIRLNPHLAQPPFAIVRG